MNKENKIKRLKVKDCSYYADKTDKQIIDRINKIGRLLIEFGVRAYAFDPGIRGYINRDIIFHDDINFSDLTWKWLEPLLEELLEYRRNNGNITRSKR